ncbi:MAG: HEAT repeat domain-containing protein [bacterium]
MIHPRFRFLLASLILPIVGIAIVIVFASRRTPAGEGRPTKTPEPAVVGALTKQPAGGEQLPPEVMRKLSDLKTRADTVRLLGEQKDRRAVSHLRSYCSDPDTTVRLNSIWALGEIGNMRSAVEIFMRTADPEPEVRLAVAVALSKLAAETDPSDVVVGGQMEVVVGGLTESLKSEDLQTRLEAAKGLAKCKNDPGIKALVDFLGHADPAVRKEAEDGLRVVGESMIPTLIKALEHPGADETTLRNVRLLALFKRQESVPTLLGVLRAVCAKPQRVGAKPQTPPPVRQVCVDALISIGPEIVPSLDEQVVKDRCSLGLKEAVADALKGFGSAAVAPIAQRIITRQIFPEELELKLWIDTLGEIGDPAAAPALSSALTKPVGDPTIYRRAVEEAVRKIETKTGKKLVLPPASREEDVK